MDDPTQAPPGAGDDPPAFGPDAPASDPAFFDGGRIQSGLLAWLVIMTLGAFVGFLLGHGEAAFFFATAGAFALAQASDAAAALDRYRAFVRDALRPGRAPGLLLRGIVRALVPVAGALFFVLLGVYAWRGDPQHPHRFAFFWCVGAALVCLSLAIRPLADAVTRALFRGGVGRTRRLAARLVVMGLLLPVPAAIVSPMLIESVHASGAEIADPRALVAQLLGELAVAVAGVGWLVRRDGRATLERLGLAALRPTDAIVIALGVGALIALNWGADRAEHALFPALWIRDRDVTRLIAGHMAPATALLLGISAGCGEEIALRGALQPRLGILLTSLLFASAHVQYTWFGMLTIGMLGLLLGSVRARSSTTVAIVVHALYDCFAALTANQ